MNLFDYDDDYFWDLADMREEQEYQRECAEWEEYMDFQYGVDVSTPLFSLKGILSLAITCYIMGKIFFGW